MMYLDGQFVLFLLLFLFLLGLGGVIKHLMIYVIPYLQEMLRHFASPFLHPRFISGPWTSVGTPIL